MLERMCRSLCEVHGTKVNTYYNSSTWKFSGNYAERERERERERRYYLRAKTEILADD